jgi:signal transduction histidine kinase
MKRPWQVWLVFTACVLSLLAGMVWLTRQTLQADRLRRAAEAQRELEQRLSLALWKMDTELAPIIAAEVIRPPSAYRDQDSTPVTPPPFVLLHFEAWPDGSWRSPQAPPGHTLAASRLTELSAAVDVQRLLNDLPDTPLPTVAEIANTGSGGAADSPENVVQPDHAPRFFEGNTFKDVQTEQPATQLLPGQQAIASKAADFEQRGKRYQSAAQQSLLNQSLAQQAEQPPVSLNHVPEQIGISRPLWIGDRLLLARRVSHGGQTRVQGAWLDWTQLKTRLLGEAAGILPKADLMPVNGQTEVDPARMLAGLPVRLVVGETAPSGAAGSVWHWPLWMGWGAVLVAVAAAAALLHGVLTLSERRAAFVSSVTHELRTPLTTFRMYAEMLARDMVPDAARRQEYFHTLQREAERLTLLVENVLAYARLERGRKPHAQDRETLRSLLDRIGPRLVQRAEQAGMQCDLQLDAATAQQEFTTDTGVVEQILFNLVDNAAKYARRTTDRRIHVAADRNGQYVRLMVRDHGPGIVQRPWSRRMQPFGKSAQESAESAPGVGLGLALCQRLARQLGGRLKIEATPGGGATVSLLLPVS